MSCTLIEILSVAYHVNISILDAVLEEEMAHVDKNNIEIRISLGARCLSVQNLVESTDIKVKVPLSTQISEDKIQIIATAPEMEDNIGSVSIP